MLISETLVDKRIDQTVKFNKRSDVELKCACISAFWVVGTYSGATEKIATESKRSVSSVQNWAHAFRLYKSLRTGRNFRRVRSLWRSLPASHWWLAYDIQQAGYDALHYLDNADQHSWSGRDMMAEYKRDRESGTAPLIFRHACYSFLGLANELSKYNLTAKQRVAIAAVLEAFGE